jgi:excisionase family DNA binding protein
MSDNTLITISEPGTPQHVYTRKEAAKIARLSLTALDEALRRGTFPHLRVGKRVLIPRVAFLRILGTETS